MPMVFPQKQCNPIQTAVEKWAKALPFHGPEEARSAWCDGLMQTAPKRFTIYEPMALLPAGSFQTKTWRTELAKRDAATLGELWRLVLKELSRRARKQTQLTHLAVNEGIPLRNADEGFNELRSPSGLCMLFGDFGSAEGAGGEGMSMDRGLWVSTRQNGIVQTWAPRWTMFSRGNVKEKARLLEFARARGDDEWALDLYAGIGYFVFCYAALGFRVACWEINPWSVEGLRRGARANGWAVRVVAGEELHRPLDEVLAGGEGIIVFQESNVHAPRRVNEMQRLGVARIVRHANCGLLPTSAPTWEAAWDMTRLSSEAWLHLHENIGANDIKARRMLVNELFDELASSDETNRQATVQHVELVKTFAPDVWHCVLDVHVTRNMPTLTNDASALP